VLAPGRDLTIVGISHMALESLRARELLGESGISAEVIDPLSLSPLDMPTIASSASRTGRLLVVDNGWTTCGAGAEILARTTEATQGRTSVLVRRMGFAPVTCPTSKPLENLFYPDAAAIAAEAHALVRGTTATWPTPSAGPELVEFKGPF
jgi:pyruvate dehydrogenase E1 component beta subunit